MTSPFNIPAMHRLKKQAFRRQADALASLGPQPTPKAKPGEQPDVVLNPAAVGRPFATEQMRQLRRRARRRVDLDTLRVWSGNEAPTLEALVNAVPPEGGVVGLIEDMEKAE